MPLNFGSTKQGQYFNDTRKRFDEEEELAYTDVLLLIAGSSPGTRADTDVLLALTNALDELALSSTTTAVGSGGLITSGAPWAAGADTDVLLELEVDCWGAREGADGAVSFTTEDCKTSVLSTASSESVRSTPCMPDPSLKAEPR